MSEEKKFCPDPYRIYSPEDLHKNWFVYYYVEGKRVRVYGDINKRRSHRGRMNEAKRLILELRERRRGEGLTIKERIYQWLQDQEPI